MLPFPIGLHLGSLRLPFRKAILVAAEMGATSVEVDLRRDLPLEEMSRTGVRQVRKWLADLNLTVGSCAFFTRHGYDSTEHFERRIAGTKEAMRVAYELGSRVVVNHFGKIEPETLSSPENPLLDALRDIALHGQRTGVTLLGTTVGEAPSRMKELLNLLPEVGVGVNLDPAGLIGAGASVASALDHLGPRILHVYARDCTREAASGTTFETALGRGSVEFPELIGRLEELGYHGPLTVRREFEVTHDELRQSIRYLKNLAS